MTMCYAQKDREEEEKERLLAVLDRVQRQVERNMRMAAPLAGKERPGTKLKDALDRLDAASRKKPDDKEK